MLDPALLEMIDVKQGFTADGLLLLNRPQIYTELSLVGAFCVSTLDATKLALTSELGSSSSPIANTVMLYAFSPLYEDIPNCMVTCCINRIDDETGSIGVR